MKKTILIAAVMFLAFSVAAFAQAQLQVSSTPVVAVTSCGSTELTGPIGFAQTTAAPITTGTISITYGAPISITTGVATATVTITDGSVPPAVIGVPVQLNSTNVNGNVLTFNTNPIVGGIPPYTITVTGVRVNVASNPNLTSLSAVISGTGNLFLGGPPPVIVISSVGPALGSLAVPVPLNLFAVSPTYGTTNVVVTEGFANAFVANEMVQLTFTGVPAGLTLTLPAIVTSTRTNPAPPPGTLSVEQFVLATSVGGLAASNTFTSTGAPINVYYLLATPSTDKDQYIETLTIGVTVAASGATPPASPLPVGTATVTANVVGIVPAAPGVPLPPQYTTSCQKGPANFIAISTATTNLLMPYATTLAGYDTGIAIANTTTDPFVAGQTAAKQDGTLTFWLFPTGGTAFSITPTTGGGLSGGVLKTGSEYVYLLSTLLSDAGKSTSFSGYVYVICNFTQGHGQYFISNFDSFTNGALMLVSPPGARGNPESLGN